MKKAYDSVPRKLLMERIIEYNNREGKNKKIANWYINLMKWLWIDGKNTSRVITRDGLSDPILIKKGLRQGGPESPISFNIFINPLLEELDKKCEGFDIEGINMSVLAFADDLLLISKNREGVKKSLEIVKEWAENNGMEFNKNKTKLIVQPAGSININDKEKIKKEINKFG